MAVSTLATSPSLTNTRMHFLIISYFLRPFVLVYRLQISVARSWRHFSNLSQSDRIATALPGIDLFTQLMYDFRFLVTYHLQRRPWGISRQKWFRLAWDSEHSSIACFSTHDLDAQINSLPWKYLMGPVLCGSSIIITQCTSCSTCVLIMAIHYH